MSSEESLTLNSEIRTENNLIPIFFIHFFFFSSQLLLVGRGTYEQPLCILRITSTQTYKFSRILACSTDPKKYLLEYNFLIDYSILNTFMKCSLGVNIYYVSFYYSSRCLHNKVRINQSMFVNFAGHLYVLNIKLYLYGNTYM